MQRERRSPYFIDGDKEAREGKWLAQAHRAGKHLREVQNSGFLTLMTSSPGEEALETVHTPRK